MFEPICSLYDLRLEEAHPLRAGQYELYGTGFNALIILSEITILSGTVFGSSIPELNAV